LILIHKFGFMIYCSKGDSYRIGHITTDASNLRIGFYIFFALKAILPDIGYNLQNSADTTIGHIPSDQDSSEESSAFIAVTS